MTNPHGGPPDWRYDLDLTDPRQAYAAGDVDGYQRRVAEERVEDERVWRAAARAVAAVVERVDRRRRADRGQLAEGQRAT